MSILQQIIIKLLVLTEGVLDIFVNPSVYNAVPANSTACTGSVPLAGTLTGCGDSLIAGLGTLIVQGVQLLSGVITALSAV